MPKSTETPDHEELTNRLKSTLWYHVGKIVDEETLKVGTNATPQYIGALTELVFSQIGDTACDLESFAKHARRTTVKTDDVLLLSRRNSDLEKHLKGKREELVAMNKERAKQRKEQNGDSA